MGENKNTNSHDIFFSYIDQFKFLFYPDKWSSVFLDYSKNEILTLLYLYRYRNANMTEISSYINAPLNTSTGVVNRLEKKKMVERIRNAEDRRVVQITLTQNALQYIGTEISKIEGIIDRVYSMLTEDEKAAFTSIFRKCTQVILENINREASQKNSMKKIRKITIE